MKRHWWAVLAAALAVAVGVPAGWALTRPSADAGLPVAAVGAPTPSAGAPSPTTDARLPRPQARPATPGRSPDRAAAQTAAPVRLVIPRIEVRAAVDPVGVDAKGSMVIPREVDRVGWYRFGPAPGSSAGAAVIAGHVDSRDQGRGALFRLRELDVGDRVDVTTADGRTVRYRVTGKQTLVKKRLPTEQLFARDGSPRLVLITCGGPFLPELSSYRDNVVVVAEPTDGAA